MQKSLFDSYPDTANDASQDASIEVRDRGERLELFGAQLVLVRNWLPFEEAESLMASLSEFCDWQQPKIRVAGKVYPIPRLQAWYGDTCFSFTYSGTCFLADPMPESIACVRDKIQLEFNCILNSVLVNLYRDEHDSMGWHADDETEFGEEPVIVSLSLGGTRRFGLKSKFRGPHDARRRAHYVSLRSGDLLIMKGPTQQRCIHNIPRERVGCSPRINLTFRKIIDNS